MLVVGLAAGIGVSAAQAGYIKGNHGYGQLYKLPNGKTEYLGSLKPAENNSMAWCVDWSTTNKPGVKAKSIKDVTSKDAAIANYVIQDHLGTPEDFPEIAIAVHELLDPGKSNTKDKYQWGYTAKNASGALKTDLARAQRWIKSATDLRGPYKIAPAVAIAPTKKTATLSGTEILTAASKKIKSFNGKPVKVTATLTGPATFTDGKKTKTFDAGTNQALKITGSGAVKASLKSAKVLPAASVKKYTYSGKASQDKIVGGGLDDAAGSKSLTVVPAGIDTKATDKADGDQKLSYIGGTVRDRVSYSGLVAGQTYKVAGELMDKASNKSTGIKASKSFKPTSTSGYVDVEFKVGNGYAGKTLVAYETISLGSPAIISHKDINDKDQSITINPHPTLPTSKATDKKDGDQKLSYRGGTVNDVVDYTSLIVGTEYRMEGELMNKATGKSTGIKSSVTFKPTSENGKVTVPFTVGDNFPNTTFVAFQRLYQGTTLIAKHENINNKDQTVTTPDYPEMDLSTKARDKADGDQELFYEGGVVTDTVSYVRAVPGHEYTIKGELMDKATGKGTGIKAEKKFTAETANGTVSLDFTVPEGFRDKTLVAFEDIFNAKGELEASHKDLDDKEQTVKVTGPTLGTTATDKADGDKSLDFAGGIIIDKVKYTGLAPGDTYTLEGEVMDKDTGVGTGVKATKEFTPVDDSGTVDVEFKVPGEHHGKTFVVFEWVKDSDGKEIAKHTDPSSVPQTFVVEPKPTVGTSASDQADGDKFLSQNGGPIIDKVKYTGLKPGTEYTVKGEMVFSGSGEPTGIKAEKKFTPKSAKGVVNLEFTIPEGFGGETLVAYEELIEPKGRVVGEHKDLNDPEQTIYVAGIGTTALDAVDGDKNLTQAGGKVKDTVAYKNLVPGTEYTVAGELMKQVKGKAGKITAEATGITGSTVFTPETPNGEVVVEFEINDTTAGYTFVAFETVTNGDTVIAEHKDPEDEAQTVYQSDAKTTLRDAVDGDQNIIQAGGKVIDTLTYTNLVPGKEYKVAGELMHKITNPDTGEVTSEATGIKGEAVFTPEQPTGEVEIDFTIPEGFDGESLVAFETVSNDVEIVAKHEDINDKEQTVVVAHIGTTMFDKKDRDKVLAEEGGNLIDRIAYTNLVPGTEYVVSGELMNKVNGEATGILGSTTFTPKEANGTVDVAFKVNHKWAGKSLVGFETVTAKKVVVAEHKDINSYEQTISVSPEMPPVPPVPPAPPVINSGLGAGATESTRNGILIGSGALLLLAGGTGAVMLRKRRVASEATDETTFN